MDRADWDQQVSEIKTKLFSEFTSEAKLIANVKEEVPKLESKFRTIQAVLDDAEKRRVKEEAVKLWLDKLKDVSNQMKNVLDEWNTATSKIVEDNEKKDEEEEAATGSTAKRRKVWPLFNFNFSVTSLLQHRDIAHKIEELNEKLDEINKEREMYGFELTRSIEEVKRPESTSFVDVSEIPCRGKVKEDLVSILLGRGSEEERNPHVISLVGPGGIGKTTLAQVAYNDRDVQAHFQIKIWVCVSNRFDQCKLAKAILESIDRQTPNMTTLQGLLGEICDKLKEKKFFLVLDDVCTEEFTMWEPFRITLKNGVQGSRILVTTRKVKVAEMMRSARMIDLGVLPDDQVEEPSHES